MIDIYLEILLTLFLILSFRSFLVFQLKPFCVSSTYIFKQIVLQRLHGWLCCTSLRHQTAGGDAALGRKLGHLRDHLLLLLLRYYRCTAHRRLLLFA